MDKKQSLADELRKLAREEALEDAAEIVNGIDFKLSLPPQKEDVK